ncbi:hypothetical protein PENSTE_c026G05165 [Penicillium steckii]|uniref:Uncharacterized protein n=1 Tax=Penicillium steckii TaxID=303698 RepID=A0A1V6SPC8_9EURO|nr:hypothetical protein PENSTE_c026G05165 [Penicillium steckii]
MPTPSNIPFPGKLVFIANPYTRDHHREGGTMISTLSIADQANVILPLLMEAFVTGFDGEPAPMAANGAEFGPYSWSTGDPALARAVSARCQEVGLRPGL